MNRTRIDEALKVAREFSGFAPVFGAGRRAQAKRVEHSVGSPFLRRQRIFNNAVVQVLDQVVEDTDRGQTTTGSQECAHHEGIAALRRDLVALQQEIASLRAQLPAQQP